MTAAVPASPPLRHALGMPAGSIRALLGLGVLGYMWLLAVMTGAGGKSVLLDKEASLAFVSLQFLMVLILTHYFSAHGHSIAGVAGTASPLGLPKGTIRLALLAGYAGLIYYMFSQFDWEADNFQGPDVKLVFRLLFVLGIAYVIGYLSTWVMRIFYAVQLPPWLLDVQAWFALLGVLLLGVLVLGRLINKGLGGEGIDFTLVEAILAGVVGFYFGARS